MECKPSQVPRVAREEAGIFFLLNDDKREEERVIGVDCLIMSVLLEYYSWALHSERKWGNGRKDKGGGKERKRGPDKKKEGLRERKRERRRIKKLAGNF